MKSCCKRRRGRQKQSEVDTLEPLSISPDEILRLSQELIKTDSKEPTRKLTKEDNKEYISADKETIQKQIVSHIEYTLGISRFSINNFSAFLSTSYSVRDRLIELFEDTQNYFTKTKAKLVNFVSMEFSLGKILKNAIMSLELEDLYREALDEFGISIDDVYEEEKELNFGFSSQSLQANCLFETLATSGYPAWGYGLFYKYGNFNQEIIDGNQIEVPQFVKSPFRIERKDIFYNISFYGKYDEKENKWTPIYTVRAVANDFLIPGFATDNTLCLRLWASKPAEGLNYNSLSSISSSYDCYYESVKEKLNIESITNAYFPENCANEPEIQLMQEMILASATLHDIINRLKAQQKKKITDLPSLDLIHLNGIRTSLLVLELLRILIDEENMAFDDAYQLTTRCFTFTCFNSNERDLQQFDSKVFERVLPRHMNLLIKVNNKYIDFIKKTYGCDNSTLSRISMIDETVLKHVRLSNIALFGSTAVNGVTDEQSTILREQLFKEMYILFPEKFSNKTNGISVRRWLNTCNPYLSNLISKGIFSQDWKIDPQNQMIGIIDRIDDKSFCLEWEQAKLANKSRLADYIYNTNSICLDPYNQLFDMVIAPIEGMRRQILSLFYAVYRYLEIVQEGKDLPPIAIIYSGKAEHDSLSKGILKLLLTLIDIINKDVHNQTLRLVYVPNYCVTVAEQLIPSADLIESLEINGIDSCNTTSLKFLMNGALFCAFKGGLNTEIIEKIGDENMFVIENSSKKDQQQTSFNLEASPKLNKVIQILKKYILIKHEEELQIITQILEKDQFYLIRDFEAYCEVRNKIDSAYIDRNEWTKMSLASVSSLGHFTSERCINEYVDELWGVAKYELPPIGSDEEEQNSRVGSLRRHHSSLEKSSSPSSH